MSKIEAHHKRKFLAGRLFLKEELKSANIDIDKALKNKQLKKIPSIFRKGIRMQCNRCLTKDHYSFRMIHCHRCNKEHLYCRNCIMMGRVLACESLYVGRSENIQWPKIKNPLETDITLTKEQNKAARAVVRALALQKKEKLIWAVCGSGKTEMLFPLLEKAFQEGLRVCLASPRKDVILELTPRLKEAFPHVAMQSLYGGSKDNKSIHAPFILSTTHQLIRFKKAFDLLIIDEIDAFPYHNSPDLHKYAKRAIKPSGTAVYLTATPRKSEKLRIQNKTLPHVFVPKRYHGHPLIVPTLKYSFQLQKYLTKNQLPPTFFEWLTYRNVPERQLLIFVPTIALAEGILPILKQDLEKYGTNSNEREVDFVHAEDEDREEKVNAFRQGKLQILLTTTILERGVTFPSIDVYVVDAGHVVFDEEGLIQIAGRAGRSVDDPKGEVIFLHDGKTRAMIQARKEIEQMNKRGGFRC